MGFISSPSMFLLCATVTALQEAVMRCTFVYREKYFREQWLGKPPLSEKEEATARKLWAASISLAMICELTAIVFARILFATTFHHRFVINFGYGFGQLGSDGANHSVMLVVSLEQSGFPPWPEESSKTHIGIICTHRSLHSSMH